MSNLKVDIFEDIKVSCRTILKETNLWDSDLIFWYLFCTFTNYKRNRQNIKIKTPKVPVSTRTDVFNNTKYEVNESKHYSFLDNL